MFEGFYHRQRDCTEQVNKLTCPRPSQALPGTEIASGVHSAGSVCKAKHLGSGRSVVLKARRNPEIGKDGDIAHEVEILQSVNHPNIIKCFGSFWNKATGYFYMVSNPSRAIHLLCLPNCCAARARISVHKPTLDVRLMSRFWNMPREVTWQR